MKVQHWITDLDKLMYERVLGWTRHPTEKQYLLDKNGLRILATSVKPTRVGATAMLVLEKCAEKESVCVDRTHDGQWQVYSKILDLDAKTPCFEAKAETLQLAICKFASQLFIGK